MDIQCLKYQQRGLVLGLPLSKAVSGSDRDRQVTALAWKLLTSFYQTNTLLLSLAFSRFFSSVRCPSNFGGIATLSYSC